MAGLKVLVAGASIAGPATAYWLARAGHQVTIVERFPTLRDGGQNIDIRTAGVTVMRKMPGMEEAVRAKVVPIEGLSFVRSDGRPYGILRATGNPDQQSVLSEYEIFRDDLARILFDMTINNENIKYVFGEQVVSIKQCEKSSGSVKVGFANGMPSAEYDLVVACDGATSRTRALGLGCDARDYTKSTNCWAAYFSIDQDLLKGSKIEQAFSAPGGRFSSVGPYSPGKNRVALLGINSSKDKGAIIPFRKASKESEDVQKRYVAEKFGNTEWKLNDIIKGMMSSPDFYASEICQVKTPNLSKGRFVMVGDAGYAPGPTGGGTTLALAGAYVLAGEINEYSGDIAAGLRGYEETMKPLINDLQKIPPFGLTVLAPQTAWGLWLRNGIFTFVTWTRIVELIQKYFAASFASSDKFPLPDYKWKL